MRAPPASIRLALWDEVEPVSASATTGLAAAIIACDPVGRMLMRRGG